MSLNSLATALRLNAEEIKDVVRSRAHCLQVGLSANDALLKTFEDIRQSYIMQVGLSTYLAEMLGDFGKVPMRYCTLYNEAGQEIEADLADKEYQPVQRFIVRHFRLDALPFKVVIRSRLNLNQVEICYL
jgi:hypothetical protein